MLVLEREVGEQIMIGDYVVTVTAIRGRKVRLGVKAPRDVPVHRGEVFERIRREGAVHGRKQAG